MSKAVEVETPHTETHHAHRDDIGAKMGMWIFLFTELMLFGGLFLLYMAYRYMHQQEFVIAASELDVAVGTLNTVILLTSSLTMALSIAAMQRGKKILSLTFLGSTFILAVLFLVNKFFEWSAKFAHGIYPGSTELAEKGNGQILFFGLYYVMTGLHGIHVIIGMIIMTFMFVFIIRGSVNQESYVKLENSGLYWHLVDLIWIFLFPLFYLLH
jgi:cytochrome c oxidase subunit 3